MILWSQVESEYCGVAQNANDGHDGQTKREPIAGRAEICHSSVYHSDKIELKD